MTTAAVGVMMFTRPEADLGLPLPTLGWWFPELSALFLVSGVIIGLIDRMGEEAIAETYVAGCADLLGAHAHHGPGGVSLHPGGVGHDEPNRRPLKDHLGISRGITVLMNDGQITGTILHWGEQALSGAGPVSFVRPGPP